MSADQNSGRSGGEPGDGKRRSNGDEGRDQDKQGGGGAEGASSDDGEQAEGGGGENKPSPLANPKVRIALIVGAVLAVMALTYCFVHYRTYGRFQQTSNDAYLSADQINVSSRLAGYVEQVLVSDNQVVREGQPLVRIDRRTPDANAD